MPKVLNKIYLAAAKLVIPLIPQLKPLEGYNTCTALELRKNVMTDFIVVGGITNLKQMQAVTDKGINAVAMCRPFI